LEHGKSSDTALLRQDPKRSAAMLFSVIYSADVPADVDVLDYAPPNVEELWTETEDDDQYEYGYLEGCWDDGHHRKWCALLNREQFDEFTDRCGLQSARKL